MISAEVNSNVIGGCVGCSLYSRKLCAALACAGEQFPRISRRRVFAADATIMAEESASVAVGTVVRGVVRGTKVLHDGREQVLSLAFPGDFFGRPFSELSEVSYEAATDVEVCVSDRNRFDNLLRNNPALEHEFLKRTFSELAAALELALILGSLSAPERIACFLLMTLYRRERLLSPLEGPPERRVATSLVSRRDIARYLGTSVETISRTLRDLVMHGIIRVIDASRFEIIDYNALIDVAGISERNIATLTRSNQTQMVDPKLAAARQLSNTLSSRHA